MSKEVAEVADVVKFTLIFAPAVWRLCCGYWPAIQHYALTHVFLSLISFAEGHYGESFVFSCLTFSYVAYYLYHSKREK